MKSTVGRNLVVALLLVVGVVGCAGISGNPGSPPRHAEPYVGTFTGQYVDGLPLYRLPPIEVVGSRSGAPHF